MPTPPRHLAGRSAYFFLLALSPVLACAAAHEPLAADAGRPSFVAPGPDQAPPRDVAADAGQHAPDAGGGASGDIALQAVDASAHVDAQAAPENVRADSAAEPSALTDAGAIGGCTFDVTTGLPPNSHFGLAYVEAIWVADADGKLVRTLAHYAGPMRRALRAYQASLGGQPIDEMTGATLFANSPREEHLLWDLRDAHGVEVADGSYVIRIETTGGKVEEVGDVVEVPFAKGAGPVDVRVPDRDNVTGIHLRCD